MRSLPAPIKLNITYIISQLSREIRGNPSNENRVGAKYFIYSASFHTTVGAVQYTVLH